MRKSLHMFLSAILLVAIATMSQAQTPIDPQIQDEEYTTTVNMGLHEFARVLAVAMNDVRVRQLVHHEVAKKFDGDYNALYSSFLKFRKDDQPILRSFIHQSLIETSAEFEANLTMENIDTLVAALPRLQIAVPVLFETWEPEVFTPLVTYAPLGVALEDIEQLWAWDAFGQRTPLDPNAAPLEPVVVISLNERTDSEGKLPPRIDTKQRRHGDYEILQSGRIFDDHEGWFQGNPEVYMTWKFLSGQSGQIFPPGFDDEGRWYYPNIRLFRWQASHDLVYTVEFWEQDSGKNDFMGSTSVYFGHRKGQCYLTSNRDVEFCMSYSPPPCTRPATPGLFIITSSNHPEFHWHSVPGAEYYEIYGYSSSSGTTLLGTTTRTSWIDFGQDISLFPNPQEGLYRYRVRAVNSGPNCYPSAASYFSNYIDYSVIMNDTECSSIFCGFE